jgi:hypothetical protein
LKKDKFILFLSVICHPGIRQNPFYGRHHAGFFIGDIEAKTTTRMNSTLGKRCFPGTERVDANQQQNVGAVATLRSGFPSLLNNGIEPKTLSNLLRKTICKIKWE